jgi:uncharacterized membrane protein
MIKTISDYLYQIQHERPYMELQLARRKAFRLVLAIFTVITIGILAYILGPPVPSQDSGPGRTGDPGRSAPARK